MSSHLERPVPLLVPEGACGLRAAVSALWILKPAGVNPRPCLRISWWFWDPHPPDQCACLLCCVTQTPQAAEPTKKWPVLGLPWAVTIAAAGALWNPPKEQFSVTSDSSYASSSRIPRFLLWLEMGILSLLMDPGVLFQPHRTYCLGFFFKEELQIFHSVSISCCQDNYLKS